ncbi:MAG: energy transducer TonB [Alphaproteobacteria bacterium]
MKIALALGAWLAVLLFSAAGMAQTSSEATYLVAPEPTTISSPIFPQNAKGDEAWVQISFTVKADGTTSDIAVTDGFGLDTFKDATIAAAKNWKFKPATADGKPTDWKNYTFDIPFTYPEMTAGAYPTFSSRYEKIIKLLQGKQYAEAKAAIQEARDSHSIRLLYEYAILETLLYSAENGLGDRVAAYRAIRSATPVMKVSRQPQGPELGTRINKKVQLASSAMLPDDMLKIALRNRFTAEANLGLYGDALVTYDRIAALEPIAPTDLLVSQRKTISDALASDQPLGISGRIIGGTWLNRPVRRKFSIANVTKGSLDKIRVSCNRQGAEMAFKEGAQWELPAKWGDCDIEVSGTDNTEFVMVQTGAATASRSTPQTPLTVLAPYQQFNMPQTVLPPAASTPY